MNKRKITYTVIILTVVAFLVAGVIYYYKHGKILKDETSETSETVSGENILPDADTAQSNTTQSNTASVSSAEAVNKANFNASMKNATTAFAATNYTAAIKYYNQAIKYIKSDSAYAGLFTVYGAQNKWKDAKIALDKAIEINPSYTDYRKWQIGMLGEKFGMQYDGLKTTYEKSLALVDSKTKVNLVTYFAGVAERNYQKADAISYWQYAISIFPANTAIYQSEIDRLNAIK